MWRHAGAPLVLRVTPKGARMFAAATSKGTNTVWGGLRNIGLAVQIATAIAEFPGAPTFLRDRYGCLAASQLNYVLGDTGRSFVAGIGANPPQQLHSREGFCAVDAPASTCGSAAWSSSAPNAQVVVGALASGPDLADKFPDKRPNYVNTELAIEYQARYGRGA